MKYRIYKMVKPDNLREIEGDGYYPTTIYREVFERLDVPGVGEEHTTMESAIEEINNKKELLTNLSLTIMPIISISWDAEVI